jgi:hypothetical protein
MNATLTWIETDPGQIWRSLDGRYAIMAVTLPENPPHVEYHVRKVDPNMAAAYPTRGTLGVLLESTPWLWNDENSVHSAQAIAERDAWSDAHWRSRNVTEDYPAEAVKPFYWPISNGCIKGGLVVERVDGRLVARVVGMGRHDDEYEPGTYAEIDLTELVAGDAS